MSSEFDFFETRIPQRIVPMEAQLQSNRYCVSYKTLLVITVAVGGRVEHRACHRYDSLKTW